jgi:hypothetical protein
MIYMIIIIDILDTRFTGWCDLSWTAFCRTATATVGGCERQDE